MLRTFPAIAVALTALATFLLPDAVESQRLDTHPQFTPIRIEIGVARTSEQFPESQISLPAFDSEAAIYTLPMDTASKGLKKRIRPYAIGGAAIGALAGLALMPKSCGDDDNMFCQYTLVMYPFIGAGVGGWMGILVGYVRERK